MNNNLLITIGRQYGSAGRHIGEELAKKLGIPFYNNELITLAAKKSGMAHHVLGEADETATNSLLYTLAMGSSFWGGNAGVAFDMPINDKLFVRQSEVIRSLAEEGSCVVIGRCADYVLKDNPCRFSVFIYGDLECRRKRVAQRHDVRDAAALDLINKTDRRRASYYNFYTGGKWGKLDNYHLAINSSALGIEGTAQAIAAAVRMKMEK